MTRKAGDVFERAEPPSTALFAGLGQMGRAMATRLADGQLRLTGIDPDEGARAAAAELGIEARARIAEAEPGEVVFACVPGPPELMAVIDECLALDPPPRFFVNLSTVGKIAGEEARDHLHGSAQPIVFVESPISGGVLKAARGEATLLWAAEPPAAADAVRPLIEKLGARTVAFESAADASTAKLANNLAMLATALGTLEALTWAVGEGLSLDQLFESLGAGTADSYALRSTLARSVRDGDFERGFAMRLALKDVRLILREAAASGLEMRFAEEIERRLDEGCAAGLGDRTFPAVAALTGMWDPQAIAGAAPAEDLKEVTTR